MISSIKQKTTIHVCLHVKTCACVFASLLAQKTKDKEIPIFFFYLLDSLNDDNSWFRIATEYARRTSVLGRTQNKLFFLILLCNILELDSIPWRNRNMCSKRPQVAPVFGTWKEIVLRNIEAMIPTPLYVIVKLNLYNMYSK